MCLFSYKIRFFLDLLRLRFGQSPSLFNVNAFIPLNVSRNFFSLRILLLSLEKFSFSSSCCIHRNLDSHRQPSLVWKAVPSLPSSKNSGTKRGKNTRKENEGQNKGRRGKGVEGCGSTDIHESRSKKHTINVYTGNSCGRCCRF